MDMTLTLLGSVKIRVLASVLILLLQWRESSTLPRTLCLDEPCQNMASCRDASSDFLCQCQSPVPSTHCDSSPELCQLFTCQGNATCQHTRTRPGEVLCHCEPGPSQHDCHSSAQLCAEGLCGDRAQCVGVRDRTPGYACVCQEGFTGAFCEREVDHCKPNPCRNRAICRSRKTGPTCFCVPGFQGERCEIEVNECVSWPCKNGATCVDKIGHYVCLCRPGYTGSVCEVELDECLSQPCLYGGSCSDRVNGFSCLCPPGFQGERCESNIDECLDQPCQHGALCVDEINGYSCDCLETGFSGHHCEIPPPLCWSKPCLNGALCEDEDRNYTCNCWPGFEGRNCETDINECESNPCQNQATCIELSWENLYGTEFLLPRQYNPRHASGVICKCPLGFSGALCEQNVTFCSSDPCHHGDCEDFQGGYKCICPPDRQDGVFYGGQNCSEPLVGCEGHECQNKAACRPFLSAGLHGYSCLCPPGFTDSYCQTSTAFSFETSGASLNLQTLLLLGSEVFFNLTFSFRTVLENVVMFQRGSGGTTLQLELRESRLFLHLRSFPEVETPSLTLSQNVSDGEWYTVQAALGEDTLLLQLLDPCLDQDGCIATGQIEAGDIDLDPGIQNTIFGGLDDRGMSFIGCMRDLFVESQLMVPEDWLRSSAVNVTQGCSHHDRCLSGPCENQGECVNLWQGYQCKCRRPYMGQNCAEESVTARFGLENSTSYAVFTIKHPMEHNSLYLSFFLRTRKESGLMMLLTNTATPYLQLWLEKGRVNVQTEALETITGESIINDGEIHFISIGVEDRVMTLQESGREPVSAYVQPVSAQIGDVVYVGGTDDNLNISDFGGHFKGCLQDLQVNGKTLQFFPLGSSALSYGADHMVEVTAGCTSDDSCSKNPCKNGGMCFSLWDDFRCACPPSTLGQRCEDVRWCEVTPCPPQATCRTLTQGYECTSQQTQARLRKKLTNEQS